MPTGDVSIANIGTPVPLSYGYFRATGMRMIDYTVPSTAVHNPNMQIGFWDLGEGELDGIDALWIDQDLQFAFDTTGVLMGSSTVGVTPASPSTTPELNSFSFHTGCDAPLGGFPGYSSVYQWIDPLWSNFSDLVTPLCYSRRAYYGISWTPPTSGGGNLTPVGDFRGMRCRIFDASGNQTGYRFTTNPIWHAVDLFLRRAIKPEYAIDSVAGPTALTTDEKSRFNWPVIYQSAQNCDYILANGQPRFSGSYVFASGSTLASMLEQVLLCCRGFWFEYAGKINIVVDMPQTSQFVISAHHYVQGSLQRDDSEVNQAPNRFVGQFREIGIPAVSQISAMVRTSTNLKITTVNPNPCAPNDIISVGGALDDSFDASYSVTTTPTTTEVDCTISGGAGASTTGGYLGYIQSRFSQRNPEISHIQHQRALGQILPPSVSGVRLKRIKVSYDFANMTYDQANRLMKYEVYRSLGLDQTPYQPPFSLSLSLYSESTDQGGVAGATRALKSVLQGEVVTVDDSILFEWAGDYEVIERYINPMQQEVQDSTDGNFIQPSGSGGSFAGATDSNSGILKLVLRTYNPSSSIFTDVSDDPNSSLRTVPGHLPYSGSSSSSTGFSILGGVFTSTTSSGGTCETSWTTISIRLASGIVLSYTAVAHHVGSLAPDSSYVVWISDPGLAGGTGKVFTGTSYPAPGVGVFNLTDFVTPEIPTTGSANLDYTL